jgi:hypothetical protein
MFAIGLNRERSLVALGMTYFVILNAVKDLSRGDKNANLAKHRRG